MKQKIISGKWDTIDLVNTAYTSIDGAFVWTALTASFFKISPVSTGGTLRNFRVQLYSSLGVALTPDDGASVTLTIRKDEVDTGLEVALTTSGTGADTTTDVAFTAGNTVDIKCVTTVQSTPCYALWTLEFEATNDYESILFCGGGPWYKTEPTGYAPLVPDCSNPHTYTEANAQQIIATSGTIKNLYVETSAAPGTGIEAYTVTLRVNGASKALTASVVATATSANDTVNEVAVVPGDLVCWLIEAVDVPTNSVNARIGFTFVANTNEYPLLNGLGSLTTSGTRYHALAHRISAWGANEYEERQYTGVLGIAKFYIRVSAAPGAGKSWVFTVMKNGAATNIAATITGTETSANDLFNTASFTNGDLIDLRCVPSGTPAAAKAFWGAVGTDVDESGGYPTDGMMRVTGIKHILRYVGRESVYNQVVQLGGLSTALRPLGKPDRYSPDSEPEDDMGEGRPLVTDDDGTIPTGYPKMKTNQFRDRSMQLRAPNFPNPEVAAKYGYIENPDWIPLLNQRYIREKK